MSTRVMGRWSVGERSFAKTSSRPESPLDDAAWYCALVAFDVRCAAVASSASAADAEIGTSVLAVDQPAQRRIRLSPQTPCESLGAREA